MLWLNSMRLIFAGEGVCRARQTKTNLGRKRRSFIIAIDLFFPLLLSFVFGFSNVLFQIPAYDFFWSNFTSWFTIHTKFNPRLRPGGWSPFESLSRCNAVNARLPMPVATAGLETKTQSVANQIDSFRNEQFGVDNI